MSFLTGGSDDSGKDALEYQKKLEKERREEEEARKKRLDEAMAKITSAFHGSAATPITQAFDWSKFSAKNGKATGLPAGYSYVQLPGTTKTVVVKTGSNTGGGHNTGKPGDFQGGGGNEQSSGDHWKGGNNQGGGGGGGGGGGSTNKTVTTPGAWVIKGPDGKTYKVGDEMIVTTGTNPATTGFDDAFYKKFSDSYKANFLPQVTKQYGEALDEATFRLARSGGLTGSADTAVRTDLYGQNKRNVQDVVSAASEAEGDLKSTIATAESNAKTQAQILEDPSIAVSDALTKVNDLMGQRAPNTTLGDIFKVATIGGAGLAGGYTSEVNAQKVKDAIANASRIV